MNIQQFLETTPGTGSNGECICPMCGTPVVKLLFKYLDGANWVPVGGNCKYCSQFYKVYAVPMRQMKESHRH